MGNGLTYRIPRFQRDYSWTDEEWDDLWLDILGTVADGGEPAHYMGYLVLQSDDERTFEVIDGQQRLTTLSIIVLAVLKNLQRLVDTGIEPEANQRRIEQLRQSYIGYLDPVTLVPRSKLTLNRNNDSYYQTYLVPLHPLPQRGFKVSEHALRKAFEYFDGHIEDYMRLHPDNQGAALASFVERMSDRLFFTVITVTDELNAYKVFETLNARGVRLSATDLLKNYLFSVLYRENLHENEFTALEDRWATIVDRLGNESFPEFLRAHWNSRRKPVRQPELFKAIRSNVSTAGDVFALVRDMEADMDTYLALTQPENSAWRQEWQEQARLLRMFGVRQPVPLLLAVRRTMDDTAFDRVLKASVVISFRYNVIGGRSAGEQESAYNAVTQAVADGAIAGAPAVINALADIYPSDGQFKEAFATRAIKASSARKRIVRYILAKLEWRLSGIEHDYSSDAVSIEHVLPVQPAPGWDTFPENELESFVDRLGNVTLLEPNKNKDLAQSDYSVKRPVYETSAYQLTRELAQRYEEWTPEGMNRRQRWMADQAVTIWKIGQLSGPLG
jgi:hypothetical protein